MKIKQSVLTSTIIRAFYDVYNQLGYGFLEKVYKNALAHALRKQDVNVKQQMPINVYYDDILVGQYLADLLVNERVIVELKAAESIASKHEAQLLNYLKATEIEVGLVLNFGTKPQFKRKIFETARER